MGYQCKLNRLSWLKMSKFCHYFSEEVISFNHLKHLHIIWLLLKMEVCLPEYFEMLYCRKSDAQVKLHIRGQTVDKVQSVFMHAMLIAIPVIFLVYCIHIYQLTAVCLECCDKASDKEKTFRIFRPPRIRSGTSRMVCACACWIGRRGWLVGNIWQNFVWHHQVRHITSDTVIWLANAV
jgi:hypothetical protein